LILLLIFVARSGACDRLEYRFRNDRGGR